SPITRRIGSARLFRRKSSSSDPNGLNSAATAEADSPAALRMSELGRKNPPLATEIAPKASAGRNAAAPIDSADRNRRRARKARQTRPTRKKPSYRDAASSAARTHSLTTT